MRALPIISVRTHGGVNSDRRSRPATSITPAPKIAQPAPSRRRARDAPS